jgi:hypothetical protein
MASERWSYQVVEVPMSLFGSTREALQERLSQLGLQGWELVSVVHPQRFAPVQLFLKKPM